MADSKTKLQDTTSVEAEVVVSHAGTADNMTHVAGSPIDNADQSKTITVTAQTELPTDKGELTKMAASIETDAAHTGSHRDTTGSDVGEPRDGGKDSKTTISAETTKTTEKTKPTEMTKAADAEPKDKGIHQKTTRHVTYSEGVDELEWDKAMKLLQQNGDQVYRMVFKNEMHRLHRELATFNEEITREYEKNARRIAKKKKALEEELHKLEQRRFNVRKQLIEEESAQDAQQQQQQEDVDDVYSVQKRALLDKELQLLEREESLTSRQQQLEEYEGEIEKIEGYLDRRMDIARRRNTELIELDGAQRAFIEQHAAANTPTDDVTEDADITRGQSPPPPPPPSPPAAAAGNAQYDLLVEKNTQLELVLKKTKADLAHSENTRQQLQTKVSELEKAQEQSNKRIAELERHMFLNETNLSSSGRRMSLHAETATNNQSLDDLPSIADSNILHSGALPAPAGHVASNIKPVRFSVKIKPSRTPSLHSAPASSASPSTPQTEHHRFTGKAMFQTEHHRFTERPALTWQQREPRRQRRSSSGISTHTSPLPAHQRRVSSSHHTHPAPHSHHHKLAPLTPPPAGNGAHGEVGHRPDGPLQDTWSDSELLHRDKAPPRSGMCVVQ